MSKRELKKNRVKTNAVFEGKPVFRSQRVESIRNKLINEIPAICSERAVYATESYEKTAFDPVLIRRAKALENVLNKMTIYISENELLVGNQGSSSRCAPIFPEFGLSWLIEELDGNPMRPENRPGDKFIISPEHETNIRSIAGFWTGNTHQDRVISQLPKEAQMAGKVGAINSCWLFVGADGHITIDLKRVVNEGIDSFKKQAEDKLAALDLTNIYELEQKVFLDAVVIICNAIIRFAARYSEIANSMARDEEDQERKIELRRISEICARIPAKPARNYYEALQACWFMNLVIQIENNGHSISLGRLDQTLIDIYRKDMLIGELTQEFAEELTACFYLKLFQLNKLNSWENTQFLSGYQLFQNITICGQDKQGFDATNELSYLFLKTQAMLSLSTPSISLRYHDRISNRALLTAVDVISLGGGQPAIYSDEVYIPALINRGIKWEDAVHYSIVGCAEAIVEGKQTGRPNGAAFVNLAKILELSLYDGYDPNSGLCPCKGIGKISDFHSYEELYEAFKVQARYYLREQVVLDNYIDMVMEKGIGDPVTSTFVADCIKRGKTLKQGGAIYDYCGPLYVGIANVGNSLAAIKKVVFEDRMIDGDQLLHALKTNFQDEATTPSGPEIRKILLDAPKYGNDDDYVDSIMVDYFTFICNETSSYRTTRYGKGPIGCQWQPSTSSVSANVPFGLTVGATPDGRLGGEALADTSSPTHGTDKKGPTASLKSVSKLPTVLVSGGQLLNIKITPQSLKDENGKLKFIALLRTFLGDLKGMHVQFNIVDASVLLDAQKNPGNYKDLMVRVAGYSALFTPMSKALQDDIIQRTTHFL